ncbi:MAG: replication-associated recombination protein A [Candidatus Fermentibacteraceae bacterium]|nr:replication-associated recombination protein A [Candidatus Fermentibacteraceae bacterium]MBN2609266.1 replication-associated recombination protein A [Candidatus Fermentibacteraceae bacterium]
MDLLEEQNNSVPNAPLADLLRPCSLDEVSGQEHLLSRNSPFRRALEEGVLGSFILWGPPGSGKTTLILLVSRHAGHNFVRFSAVTGGVKQVRSIVEDAARLRRQGLKTLLFVDEIHRFNKAQQDAFLPHVEDGTICLAGATTENPSFEIIAPLLSRCTVYVLRRLENEQILSILRRAAAHPEFRSMNPGGIEDGVLEDIASCADGDGRRALNMLELLAGMASGEKITTELFRDAAASSPLSYDKSGEEHYNLISALHKSLRSSDVDASLYWLARMILSGENPLYIARRMIRFATEDVGLADPSALTVAMRAADSWRFLGSPEGDLALAEAACYLALAPKSNSVYTAWQRAVSASERGGSLPVPLHLRNAPTRLMKELDYGKDYQYAHGMPGGTVTHVNFPVEMREEEFYIPSDAGREADISKKLSQWKEIRNRTRAGEAEKR